MKRQFPRRKKQKAKKIIRNKMANLCYKTAIQYLSILIGIPSSKILGTLESIKLLHNWKKLKKWNNASCLCILKNKHIFTINIFILYVKKKNKFSISIIDAGYSKDST